ncbi:ribosomal RNA small subunit methyltransferase G [Chloropicon primus]|uniref:Ribosomal RNA small subunit methyltransferase G n=1 Tax=Chloropicon primus TaxID=1764295 RepID=A0A5B8MSW8_9CHLO|nr:ribosomal RNA small subunit methyltransferase G [Chloropicon primus]UPR02668.1 ribosomal RNA small subunit methyltransferase G [Chloropicon primus]|eukprot:QDZ23456.1 ribosomal RNA small subunit methyltransferase G [Chloropicon primus]
MPRPYAYCAIGVRASSSPSSSGYSLLSAEERKQFDTYLESLFEYNAKFNLTAVKTREEAQERHIEDSLALLPVLDECVAEGQGQGKGLRVIDVGTGPGLPGIVLAVKRPHWDVTLLDSLQKRCKFLEEVKESLELKNVEVTWSRAEDVGRDAGKRGSWDLAVARAVAPLNVLCELCVPMLRVGGYLVAAKGPDPEAEVKAARNALGQLKAEVVGIIPVSSFGSHGQRTVVVIRKVGETPRKFPRQAGTPKKKPL